MSRTGPGFLADKANQRMSGRTRNRIRQLIRNIAENIIAALPKYTEAAYQKNTDQRRDEAVLDGRRAFLVLEETIQKLDHAASPRVTGNGSTVGPNSE